MGATVLIGRGQGARWLPFRIGGLRVHVGSRRPDGTVRSLCFYGVTFYRPERVSRRQARQRVTCIACRLAVR